MVLEESEREGNIDNLKYNHGLYAKQTTEHHIHHEEGEVGSLERCTKVAM